MPVSFAIWDETTVDVGLNLSEDCLMWIWQECMNVDHIISIREKSDDNMTVMTVVQDAVLTATFLVWTVLTIVLIYCGLMFIIQPWKSKQWKEWMIKSWLGALLVRWAYTIVQVIQYVAAQ